LFEGTRGAVLSGGLLVAGPLQVAGFFDSLFTFLPQPTFKAVVRLTPGKLRLKP
jgi:hypothetical protein